MSGRCDFFNGARVVCGSCGKSQEFAQRSGGGGDTLARKAGWQIEWRPQPHVRCPKCLASSSRGAADGGFRAATPRADGEAGSTGTNPESLPHPQPKGQP